MKTLTASLLTFSGLLFSGVALAQTPPSDPAPPLGSAFVRVLNAANAALGSKAVKAQESAASPYVAIPQGEFTAKVGTVSGKLKVEAGNFYSVFARGSALVLLTDQPGEQSTQALLTMYNLSKVSSVDLKTTDGKTKLLAGVKPGKSETQAVEGTTLDLSVFDGSRSLAALKNVKLDNGSSYALVLTDTGLTLTLTTTQTE